MEVVEVIRLADWFSENSTEVLEKYSQLVSVLKHNAQQQNLQPVSKPLAELSDALADMPIQQLSTLQRRVLNELEVDHLIGKLGRKWVNHTIKSMTYDPATTFQTVQQASQRISEAERKLIALEEAAKEVGFFSPDLTETPTPYVINVIFQGGAAIENVRDWKSSASDWELIIAGVSGVASEKVEEVKVVSTSNGSIIFTLCASPLVTKILATISKHIASIANDYLDFQIKREQLERSQMMTKVIANDLKKQEGERRSEGQKAIIDAVKAIVPNAPPETIGKLEKAVSKHIAFSEHGGEVDFVSPPEVDEDADDYDEDLAETVDEVRALIEEYRAEKQKIELLTYQTDAENEED